MVVFDSFVPYKQIFIIILGVLSLLFLFLKSSLLYSFLCKDNEHKLPNSGHSKRTKKRGMPIIHIITFISISLFCGSTYVTLISIIYDIDGMNRSSGAAYIFAQWLMLLSFVLRIHLTFKNSVMEYSKTVIILLYIACFTCFALLLMMGAGFYLEINVWFLIILMVLWTLIYVSFALLLMILFLRKIELCMIAVFKQNLSDIRQGMESMKKDEVLDMNIINASIKYSLLVCVAIITSFIAYSMDIGIYYRFSNSPLKNIGFIIAMIDGFISSICMYLFYPFNLSMYNIICKPAHKCCEIAKKYQIIYCFHLTLEEKNQFRDLLM